MLYFMDLERYKLKVYDIFFYILFLLSSFLLWWCYELGRLQKLVLNINKFVCVFFELRLIVREVNIGYNVIVVMYFFKEVFK